MAPGHFIFEQSEKLAPLCFRSGYNDFRKNDLFGFFESAQQFEKALKEHFSQVEVIQYCEKYQDISLSFFIGIAKK